MSSEPLCLEFERNSLTRYISPEEKEAIWREGMDALLRGDRKTGHTILAQLPIRPFMAKHMFECVGKELCETSFNLYDANQEFGEGWMDG